MGWTMSDTEKIDTSDEACALVCMLVSNPGGGERPHAWQRRVNDLIRALRDERNSLLGQVRSYERLAKLRDLGFGDAADFAEGKRE